MNLDRTRKHLFDSRAELYDRLRPGYPQELVDEVLAYSGAGPASRVLEIGSGTGKATVEFARRGLPVECIEPGPELCRVCRDNCSGFPRVSVRTTDFESAELESGAYDMVFSAQAFHWVLPSVRYRKAAKHLRAGGTLAVFWNFFPESPDGPVRDVEELFRKRVPGMFDRPAFPYRKTISRWRKELARRPEFEALSVREYPWAERYSADEYEGFFHTHSDFLALPEELRDELSADIRRIVETYGGFVERRYLCVLYCLRKRSWDE